MIVKSRLLLVALTLSFAFMTPCASASGTDPCLGCHEKKTPFIVEAWKKSRHFVERVGCADCHGNDREASHSGKAVVDAVRCGACHGKALEGHRLSRHGIGLKAGRGCTRNMESSADRNSSCIFCHTPGETKPLVHTECAMFLAQTPEVQRQGCDACHRIEISCEACHTKHGTDLAVAKDPGTCGTCHMGPDHPQLEMWETSRHGVLYRHGGESSGPSCVTCHMRGGSHNVSRGISSGLPDSAAELKNEQRDYMIRVCAGCHSSAFAKKNLDDADRVEKQGRELLEKAGRAIEDLQKRGLLLPEPTKRPPHPLFGRQFVLGQNMLYEDLSSVESLYFRIKQFYYPTLYKGVFHQNPDYAHWYGNAPLKLTLSEIESQAELLKEVENIRERIDNLDAPSDSGSPEVQELKRSLRELNRLRLRGEITEEEYEHRKEDALKKGGL